MQADPQFRDALRQAADSITLDPDADLAAARRLGTRRRRGRRIGLGIASCTTALALVVGIGVGWGLVRDDAADVEIGPRDSVPPGPDEPVPAEGEGEDTVGGDETGEATGDDSERVVFDDFESGQVWVEIEAPASVPDVDLSSSGGVFYMIGTEPSETCATSTDGVEWTDHELPDGLLVRRFAASADMWAVVADEPDGRFVPDRVFISDDRGATWTELVVDLTTSTSPSPFLIDGPEIADVGVIGTTVVVMATTKFVNGTPADDEFWSEVTMLTSLAGEPLKPTETVALDAGGFSDETLYVTDRFSILSADVFRQFGGDTATAPVPLTSTDGVVWTRPDTPTDGIAFGPPLANLSNPVRITNLGLAVRPDGFWLAAGIRNAVTIQRSADGATLDDIVTFPGLGSPHSPNAELWGGPAGLAATAAYYESWPTDSGNDKQVVGWAVDGLNWQWQPVEDAFGLDDRPYELQLAVGNDVAIALVDPAGQPRRWFTTLR